MDAVTQTTERGDKMSNNCFICHHRKTQGNVEHRVDVTAHKINNELNITSSKVVINNGDMFDCNYTSIDLPHDVSVT